MAASNFITCYFSVTGEYPRLLQLIPLPGSELFSHAQADASMLRAPPYRFPRTKRISRLRHIATAGPPRTAQFKLSEGLR